LWLVSLLAETGDPKRFASRSILRVLWGSASGDALEDVRRARIHYRLCRLNANYHRKPNSEREIALLRKSI
jgi:hypothetical protein